ncbi:MAG: YbfB/YjiJ family MFS transporter, partial [Sciscionella sp.]
LVLPSMRSELHWSFATSGAVNTANMIGYLAGAVAAASIASRWGERRAFLAGIAVAAVALAASALSADTVVFGLFRFVVGAAGAVSFVAGGALAARAGTGGSEHRSALMLGLYAGGAGVGMVVSGIVIEPLLAALPGTEGWRAAWLVLGVLALLTILPAAVASRAVAVTRRSEATGHRGFSTRSLWPILIAYGVFGAGYIAYLTFIVALLRSARAGTVEITVFWSVVGITATGCGLVWSGVLARLSGGRGVALVLAVLSVAAFLPTLSTATASVFASAVLFGVSFLAVVTAVIGLARRSLPSHQWSAGIGGLTAAFAVGQCVGPVLSGVLSDTAGGVRLGVGVGAALLGVAALIALTQREVPVR